MRGLRFIAIATLAGTMVAACTDSAPTSSVSSPLPHAANRSSAALGAAVTITPVGGFSLPADAGQNTRAFELCLHDAAGEPALPASNPDQSGCTHCVFCFAGAHHAVIGTAPAVFHSVDVAMVVVAWPGDSSGPRRLARYTIASPRGPPLSV